MLQNNKLIPFLFFLEKNTEGTFSSFGLNGNDFG